MCSILARSCSSVRVTSDVGAVGKLASFLALFVLIRAHHIGEEFHLIVPEVAHQGFEGWFFFWFVWQRSIFVEDFLNSQLQFASHRPASRPILRYSAIVNAGVSVQWTPCIST